MLNLMIQALRWGVLFSYPINPVRGLSDLLSAADRAVKTSCRKDTKMKDIFTILAENNVSVPDEVKDSIT